MTSKEFWNYVDEKAAELRAEATVRTKTYKKTGNIADLEGQPENGHSLYIVSRKALRQGVSGGHVVETSIRLGAQRIVEETHEVATAEQIQQFLLSRTTEREQLMKDEEFRNRHNAPKLTVVVNQDGTATAVPGLKATK
jgi:hypothetical protein